MEKKGHPVQIYGNYWVNDTADRQTAAWVSYIIRQNLHGLFHIGVRDLYGYTAFQKELAKRLGLRTLVFEIEENPEKQVLAVVPGRQEIPEVCRWMLRMCFVWLAGGKNG